MTFSNGAYWLKIQYWHIVLVLLLWHHNVLLWCHIVLLFHRHLMMVVPWYWASSGLYCCLRSIKRHIALTLGPYLYIISTLFQNMFMLNLLHTVNYWWDQLYVILYKYGPVIRAIWSFKDLRQQYWPRQNWGQYCCRRSIIPILLNKVQNTLLNNMK